MKAMKSNSKTSLKFQRISPFKVSHCQVHWPHPSEHPVEKDFSRCTGFVWKIPSAQGLHQRKALKCEEKHGMIMNGKGHRPERMTDFIRFPCIEILDKGRSFFGVIFLCVPIWDSFGCGSNHCSPKWIPKKITVSYYLETFWAIASIASIDICTFTVEKLPQEGHSSQVASNQFCRKEKIGCPQEWIESDNYWVSWSSLALFLASWRCTVSQLFDIA